MSSDEQQKANDRFRTVGGRMTPTSIRWLAGDMVTHITPNDVSMHTAELKRLEPMSEASMNKCRLRLIREFVN